MSNEVAFVPYSRGRGESNSSACSLARAIGSVASTNCSRSRSCCDRSEGEARGRVASDDDGRAAGLADTVADGTSHRTRSEADGCEDCCGWLHFRSWWLV